MRRFDVVHIPAGGPLQSAAWAADDQGMPADAVPALLSEAVASLSRGLDLSAGRPKGHAGGTCMIAMRLAAMLDVDPETCEGLYWATLLKDAGASTIAARLARVLPDADELATAREIGLVDMHSPRALLRFVRTRTGAGAAGGTRRTLAAALGLARSGGELVGMRSATGARIVDGLGVCDRAASAVAAFEERWDGSGRPDGLRGEQIPLCARIGALAQAADLALDASGMAVCRDVVGSRRGTWFDPDMVAAFLAIPDRDPLWTDHRRGADPDRVARLEPVASPRRADDAAVDRLADGFAMVIDAKSPYTEGHSAGVARHAEALARALGLPPGEIRDLRRAALLRDIGALGIPNAILDREGPLGIDERVLVERHTRDTEQILADAAALAPFALVASAHHERVDGRGYHRGLAGARLPMTARILAAADAFAAMRADRPHRPAMDVERILALMQAEAGSAYDPDVLVALEAGAAAEWWTPPDPVRDGSHPAGRTPALAHPA